MKSGLSFEQVQGIIAAAAVDTIRHAKGGLKANGRKLMVYFNYMVNDPEKPSGRRQVRVSRQTEVPASELKKATYKAGGKQRRILIDSFRDDILADVRSIRGTQSDPTSTLRAVCEDYIRFKSEMGAATEQYGHGRGIKAATSTSYKESVRRLEGYAVYDMRLADITPSMMQGAVNEMCRRYSGSSISKTVTVIRQACAWCLGARAESPCDGVVLPSVKYVPPSRRNAVAEDDATPRGRRNIVPRAEMGGVIATAIGITGRAEGAGVVGVLGLCCGLRIGEIAALTWGDIHLDAETPYLEVRHAVTTSQDEAGHYIYQLGTPKSRAGVRNVPIPAAAVTFLKARRAQALEALLALEVEGEKKSISQLYVCGDLDGNFRSPVALGASWRRYAKAHGIVGSLGEPLSCHQLRDSYASSLIDDGVPVLRVSHLLGHETVDVTLRSYVFGCDEDSFESIVEHADLFVPKAQRA